MQGSGQQAVSVKHFHEALKSVRPSCLRGSLGRTDLSPVSWEQIGGLDEIKLKLKQVQIETVVASACVMMKRLIKRSVSAILSMLFSLHSVCDLCFSGSEHPEY